MTVCIATICYQNGEPRIILCSDMKVSSSLGSAETMLKNRLIYTGTTTPWHALTAGTDTDIAALLSATRAAFKLHRVKRQRVEQIVQSKFAMGYDEFLKTGKQSLPDDAFRMAITEIDMASPDVEFIVAGFESDRFPILIKTHVRDGAKIKEEFACIGEGAYLAQASLLNRGYSDMMPFNTALYAVYEAKRFAEGAPSVGSATSMAIASMDGNLKLVNLTGIRALRALYDSLGRKPLATIAFDEESSLEATGSKTE